MSRYGRMTQPRNDWQGYLNRTLRKYPAGLDKDGTRKALEAKKAIEAVLARIAKLEDGMDRLAFYDMVYFRKTHTIAGAAIMVNISERTAHRWARQIIQELAKELGYT